jgi:hypothetical protein
MESSKAWFYPSRGLNVLFKRAGPKPDGMKSIAHSLQSQNLSCNSTVAPSFQQRRSYAEVLKMDARGNGKNSGNGRREEDEHDRVPTHEGQSSDGNPGDRRFNPARNG